MSMNKFVIYLIAFPRKLAVDEGDKARDWSLVSRYQMDGIIVVEGFCGSNPKLQEYFLNTKPVNPGIKQLEEVCVCVCWRWGLSLERLSSVVLVLIKSKMHKTPGYQKAWRRLWLGCCTFSHLVYENLT